MTDSVGDADGRCEALWSGSSELPKGHGADAVEPFTTARAHVLGVGEKRPFRWYDKEQSRG